MTESTRLSIPSTGTRLLWETYDVDVNTYKKTGKLEALDVNDGGKSLWQQLAPGSGATVIMLPFFADGQHSSAGGYFLYLGDRLYAVDPADGKVAWQSAGEWAFKGAVASPDGTTVYALGAHYAKACTVVQAFDAKTGAVRWSGSLSGGALQDMAAHFADRTLYIWIHGKVWALDPATGSPAGPSTSTPAAARRPPCRTGPAAGGSTARPRRAWWRSPPTARRHPPEAHRPAGPSPGP